MIYTIVHEIYLTDKDETKYIAQRVDSLDITNISPEMELELLSAEELGDLPESARGNFTVTEGEVDVENLVEKAMLPEANIILSKHNRDDLWHFLDLMSKANLKLIFGKTDFKDEEGYSDLDKLYLSTPRSMVYSTSHASCSLYQLIDGLHIDQVSQEVTTVSRWTSIKIVENNELKRKVLVFLCTKDVIDDIREESSIKLSVIPYTTLCSKQLEVELDTPSEMLYYCVAYLESVPLVNLNKNLIANIPYSILNVDRFNNCSQYLKVLRAFKKYTESRNPGIISSIYGKQEDIYKPKYVSKTKAKQKGIKFNLAGSVSMPSLNKCIKSLDIADFGDFMMLTDSEIENLEINVSNAIQRDTLEFLVNTAKEYRATNNPIINYNTIDALIDLYTTQRELYKKRLNLLRSMLMVNLPEEVFNEGTKLQTAIDGKVFNIQIMEGE